jgi:dihydroneopterin aldolase/2-amino-4-hydroxy-6-hydroxymethyldihydropteridine diphosphokinase/dihydropteroate synthase
MRAWLSASLSCGLWQQVGSRGTATDSPSITPELIHPAFGTSVAELLSRVAPGGSRPSSPSLTSKGAPSDIAGDPAVMAIFNATPDSFSDGNERHTEASGGLERLTQLASARVPAIIDIGGMSTRPTLSRARQRRRLSARRAPRQAARAAEGPLASIPLSVDTYRPEVALTAVKAGASCINDVRGGARRAWPPRWPRPTCPSC